MNGIPAISATIDEYIKEFPLEVQTLLGKLRLTIHNAAPAATEKISYRMPTFHLNGNLVHFAAYAHHIGLYPTSSGIDAFQQELKKYKTSKGAIQEPLPLALIEKIVIFRVQENSLKASQNKKRT